MKRNIIVLQEMFKTVSMGISGINDVKGKIKCSKLKDSVIDAKKKYQRYKRKIVNTLKEYDVKPDDINILIKLSSGIWTDMKLTNASDSEIVGMLMEGTNKGIIKLQEIKNNENIDDKKISRLLDKLLKLFEYQVNAWKLYL